MQRHSLIVVAAVLAALSVCQASAGAQTGERKPAQAELVCKLKSSGNSWVRKVWTVRIRKATGQLIRTVLMRNNESVQFKNLDSGIYVVCVSGQGTAQQCESVDLMVSENQKSLRHFKELNTPPAQLTTPDLYRVDVAELSVPEEAVEEMRKAEAAEKNGDLQQGIQLLEHALELCPNCTKAINNLGAYWYHLGQHDRAIEYFTRATEIDPQYCLAWINLASSLLAVGRAQEALDASTKAVVLCPENPAANGCLATSYFRLWNWDKAKKYFTKLLALDPANVVSPQVYLFHIALSERDAPAAERYLRSYLQFHPNAPAAAHYKELLDALLEKRLVFEPEPPQF